MEFKSDACPLDGSTQERESRGACLRRLDQQLRLRACNWFSTIASTISPCPGDREFPDPHLHLRAQDKEGSLPHERLSLFADHGKPGSAGNDVAALAENPVENLCNPVSFLLIAGGSTRILLIILTLVVEQVQAAETVSRPERRMHGIEWPQAHKAVQRLICGSNGLRWSFGATVAPSAHHAIPGVGRPGIPRG
jgi:hypothetical protein